MPASKTSEGDFYLLKKGEVTEDNVKDVALFPHNQIPEVTRYLAPYRPQGTTVLRAEEVYKVAGVQNSSLDPRDIVLEEYIKTLDNSTLRLEDLLDIKYYLYKTIDTYGLDNNAFVDFLNKYAHTNGNKR